MNLMLFNELQKPILYDFDIYTYIYEIFGRINVL